jgi:hypothetical protein
MVALVAVETLILVLLSILVVGLLRSHAEILRRLGPPERQRAPDALAPPSIAADRGDAPAAIDVVGLTLDGDAVQIGLGPGGADTLLAFLSSGCATCERLWRDFKRDGGEGLPGQVRLAVVVKDSSQERPARLRELAPASLRLVMSSAAWEDYSIPTSPYFVYVHGKSGRIYGEGTAGSWQQVASLLADALDDLGTADAGADPGERPVDGSAAARALRAERALRDAGIGPGHPSLYPNGGDAGEAL